MLLRDRLRARLDEMGDAPDYSRLAAEVLGIRNAPSELARRLVAQALVLEDRQEEWRGIGERMCAEAPTTAGVYVLRDEAGTVLYVGKAVNLRRRLRAHFAARRWRGLKAPLARADAAEWHEVGSELEALLRGGDPLFATSSRWSTCRSARPTSAARACRPALVKDVIVVLPSVEDDSAELVAARTDGGWMMQRTRRSGADLRSTRGGCSASSTHRCARRGPGDAGADRVLLAGGPRRDATRLDPHDCATVKSLQSTLRSLLADDELFAERIVVR